MATPHIAQEIIGTLLEIAGSFLLAVEAIKLENLRIFREKCFGKPLRSITPWVRVRVDATEKEIEDIVEKARNRSFIFLGFVGFAVLVLIVSLSNESLADLASSLISQFLTSPWKGTAIGFIAIVLTMGFSLLLGFFLYKMVELPFRVPFKALQLIEDNTASGGIGILGFILFLLGSLIHIWIKLAA